MYNLKKMNPATYVLPKEGAMRVPGLVIANTALLEELEIQKPLEQVRNVACLQGIVNYSIAMPDMHWGYGFPIGGVAAFDAEKGLISPGGVGYDINCGVRLAVVPIAYKEMSRKIKDALLHRIYKLVPSGVGKGQKEKKSLTEHDYDQLLQLGASWSIDQGYGFKVDLEHMESHGIISGADVKAVSAEAKLRGQDQLGTIGSGNHFVEIGEVSELYLPEIAKAWKVEEGMTYVLIHSGSRGFGHQVCQDYLNSFIKQGFAEGLPDRQLVAAPINSKAGQRYFGAMAAAANFAFNNRQQILHAVREGFSQICKVSPESIRLIYDVCHNIAKFEKHLVNGVMRTLCVHRKGATRAFGPGSEELNPIFRETGQPVLVPGDMGRASHLMAGLGNSLTWCSACHGAGRAKSRHEALKTWGKGRDARLHMEEQGILVMSSSYRTIAEEMPDAYKNVDDVVAAVEEAGLAKRVARLTPGLVLKG